MPENTEALSSNDVNWSRNLQNTQQLNGWWEPYSYTKSISTKEMDDGKEVDNSNDKLGLEIDIMFNRLNLKTNKRISFVNVYSYLSIEENLTKENLLKLSEEDPFGVFLNFDKFKNKPFSKEILQKASELISGWNLDNKYLIIWEIMNQLHNESEEIRFMVISNFDETKLYKLIYLWRSEVFTSTYNVVINKLLLKLKETWKDIYDLVEENNFKWLNIFIEAAFSYWRASELFNTIKDSEKRKKLIDIMFDEKNIVWETSNYIAIIEMINNLKWELVEYIETKIMENYKSWVNPNSWWIILKYFLDKFKSSSSNEALEKYKLPEINWIKSKDLFDEDWRNIQQYFFYNDEDWKSSFEHFISSYKWKKEWNISDKWSFVIIKSKPINWKCIIIFANKPENDWESEGLPNWSKAIKENMDSITPPLKSIVVVHRWHSFHANKTIEQITPLAKMVFLGSCWGFQNIWKVLDKSNEAQIISTRWTWTMLVNDPLFKLINEQIVSWKDINWKEIWGEITSVLKNNKNFKEYVRPDENLWMLFYKKFKELEANK